MAIDAVDAKGGKQSRGLGFSVHQFADLLRVPVGAPRQEDGGVVGRGLRLLFDAFGEVPAGHLTNRGAMKYSQNYSTGAQLYPLQAPTVTHQIYLILGDSRIFSPLMPDPLSHCPPTGQLTKKSNGPTTK